MSEELDHPSIRPLRGIQSIPRKRCLCPQGTEGGREEGEKEEGHTGTDAEIGEGRHVNHAFDQGGKLLKVLLDPAQVPGETLEGREGREARSKEGGEG